MSKAEIQLVEAAKRIDEVLVDLSDVLSDTVRAIGAVRDALVELRLEGNHVVDVDPLVQRCVSPKAWAMRAKANRVLYYKHQRTKFVKAWEQRAADNKSVTQVWNDATGSVIKALRIPCVWCGRGLISQKNRQDSVTVDHLEPAENRNWSAVVPACKGCNHLRGRLPASEWVEKKLQLILEEEHAEYTAAIEDRVRTWALGTLGQWVGSEQETVSQDLQVEKE